MAEELNTPTDEIKAQELPIRSYYDALRRTEFADSNLYCKTGLEFLISRLLYKGDISRVLYSKEDICFRRRVETLGQGNVKGGTYNYLNLGLPFTCYSQTGNYEPDDRPAAMNASAAIKGWYHPESGLRIKFMPVKIEYTMTSFYSQRQDVNIAAQLLYWEANPKWPVYYVVQHTVAGHPVDVPVFMSIEQTDQNVEYQEKDFLTKSRIFPIKTKVVVRTYQTLIEFVDPKIRLPIRFAGLYGYTDDKIYFTQHATLIWADNKFTPKALDVVEAENPDYMLQEGPQLANHGKMHNMDTVDNYSELFVNRYRVEDEIEKLHNELAIAQSEFDSAKSDDINARIKQLEDQLQYLRDEIVLSSASTVEEAVKGYFSEDEGIVLDTFMMTEVEEREAILKWELRPEDVEQFAYMTVFCPGIVNMKIDDVNVSSLRIKDLYPGSEYELVIITHSKAAAATTYKLTFTTLGEPIYPMKKLSDHLVSKAFNMNTFTGRS